MSAAPFALLPFPSGETAPDIAVSGWIEREGPVLAVEFHLEGNIGEVVLPGPSASPRRKQRLWESTCFELFLGPEQTGEYWEYNISPSGDWNVFHFDDYREGMREDGYITVLPVSVRKEAESLSLSAEFPLPGGTPLTGFRAGISAVVAFHDGTASFWALNHLGEKPDFHLRGGFTMTLPPTRTTNQKH
ncbi:MAG: DOMON-like domain-containing protein [Desulfobacteraceae bacterium]|nr:DOMON-like domain-containing protein [Desulfobacteraceae bacterium]